MSTSASLDPSEALGIGILLVSLFCLGTWPALLRLSSYDGARGAAESSASDSLSCCYCFQITPLNRHPCHAYIDYGCMYALASVVPILMELLMKKQNADDDKHYFVLLPLVLVSMLGGTLLSVGNMCMQWSTAVYGCSLTTVLALQASLTVVIGTSTNYFLQPERTSHFEYLFLGVLLFLLAIGLAARAQVWYSYGVVIVERAEYGTCEGEVDEIELYEKNSSNHRNDVALCSADETQNDTLKDAKNHQHTTTIYSQLHHNNHVDHAISSNHSSNDTHRGLLVAVFGGVCFGGFSPCFNIAVNNPFQNDSTATALSVPAANLYFALAFSIVSVCCNVWLMTYPPKSHRNNEFIVEQSTIYDYLHNTQFPKRKLAFYAGALCAFANVLQFQGGKLAGFAAADMVQAFPLVATLWDVCLFGEFRNCEARVIVLLCCMYLAYLGGIALLACSIV